MYLDSTVRTFGRILLYDYNMLDDNFCDRFLIVSLLMYNHDGLVQLIVLQGIQYSLHNA